MSPLAAGVLAAGEGTRLGAFGVPKPLVQVGGRTLLERTLGLLALSGCDPVGLIVNEASRSVADHAQSLALPFRLETLVRSTPSSLHSLHALGAVLRASAGAPSRFLLFTVDSIVRPAQLLAFVERWKNAPSELDLLLTYTDFVDDESPLRIAVEGDGKRPDARVTAVGPGAAASPFVTVGAYGMSDRVLTRAAALVAAGETRLRTLLGRLVEEGFRVEGHCLGKAIDVDRPEDVAEAERFLAEDADEETR